MPGRNMPVELTRIVAEYGRRLTRLERSGSKAASYLAISNGTWTGTGGDPIDWSAGSVDESGGLDITVSGHNLILNREGVYGITVQFSTVGSGPTGSQLNFIDTLSASWGPLYSQSAAGAQRLVGSSTYRFPATTQVRTEVSVTGTGPFTISNVGLWIAGPL